MLTASDEKLQTEMEMYNTVKIADMSEVIGVKLRVHLVGGFYRLS